jgi:hypothetical protein
VYILFMSQFLFRHIPTASQYLLKTSLREIVLSTPLKPIQWPGFR